MNTMIPYRYRNHISCPTRSAFAEDFFRPFFFGGENYASAFQVDVKDEGDYYVLEADLPGVNREDVNISIDDGVLNISAEWKTEKKDEKKNGYIMNERRSGKVSRSFTLENIKEDEVSAAYTDGVLKLNLPKMNESEKTCRRIDIQ